MIPEPVEPRGPAEPTGPRPRRADARHGAGLADEVRDVQNPALGAVLLWRSVVAHEANGDGPAGVPIPALYLVLPLVLHGPTVRHVLGTQPKSGLRKFAAKFSDSKNAQSDLLLAVHERARAMRALSTEALRIAVTSGLLRVAPSEALTFASPQRLPTRLPPSVGDLLRGAQRVGHWFRPLSLGEIAFTLDVRF